MKPFLLKLLATVIAVPVLAAVVFFLIGLAQSEFGTLRPLPVPYAVAVVLLFCVLIQVIWAKDGGFDRRLAAWFASAGCLLALLIIVLPLTSEASLRAFMEHGSNSFATWWPALVFYGLCLSASVLPARLILRRSTPGVDAMGWSTKKFLKSDTEKVLRHVLAMHVDIQRRCAQRVLREILSMMKEMDGVPAPSAELDRIVRRHLERAKIMRNQAIAMGARDYNDPEWATRALVESWLFANTGVMGAEAHEKIGGLIMGWLRHTLSAAEIEAAEHGEPLK